jgi:glucose/mannose transport system substrate-binding protein
MGDWAQGEFAVAGEKAGEDYTCLPGLGVIEVLSTGGDAFYFPETGDPEIEAAQDALAATLLKPSTQVAFNLKKGSLPIRGDVDLSAANDCMKKGLQLLADGKTTDAKMIYVKLAKSEIKLLSGATPTTLQRVSYSR